MSSFSLIVAESRNHVIGVNQNLPWHLPEDLKYFKELTIGKSIIMGRKTFESIGKPLPKRNNFVVTRQDKIHPEIYHSKTLKEALNESKKISQDDVFVIGGEKLFQEALQLTSCQKIYRTIVDTEIKGDKFFPVLDDSKWEVTSERHRPKDKKNVYDMYFQVLIKK